MDELPSEFEYRTEEGWHIFTHKTEPGLYVASRDYEKARASVVPSLKKLLELDAGASTSPPRTP